MSPFCHWGIKDAFSLYVYITVNFNVHDMESEHLVLVYPTANVQRRDNFDVLAAVVVMYQYLVFCICAENER